MLHFLIVCKCKFSLIILGVAKAFGEEITPNPQLVELCSKYFGTNDLDSPKLKMAKVHEGFFTHLFT